MITTIKMSSSFIIQIANTSFNNYYIRNKWDNTWSYSPWQKLSYEVPDFYKNYNDIGALKTGVGTNWQYNLNSTSNTFSVYNGGLYVFGYDYLHQRQGIMQIDGNNITWIVKPYSFDTYFTITMTSYVVTITFKQASTVGSASVRTLVVE